MRQCEIVRALRRDEKGTSQRGLLLCVDVGMIVITDKACANVIVAYSTLASSCHSEAPQAQRNLLSPAAPIVPANSRFLFGFADSE
jgi:hypothetical protein